DAIRHANRRAQTRTSAFIRFQLSARVGSNGAPKSPPPPSVQRPRRLDWPTRYAFWAAERPPHAVNTTASGMATAMLRRRTVISARTQEPTQRSPTGTQIARSGVISPPPTERLGMSANGEQIGSYVTD